MIELVGGCVLYCFRFCHNCYYSNFFQITKLSNKYITKIINLIPADIAAKIITGWPLVRENLKIRERSGNKKIVREIRNNSENSLVSQEKWLVRNEKKPVHSMKMWNLKKRAENKSCIWPCLVKRERWRSGLLGERNSRKESVELSQVQEKSKLH